MRPMGIAPGDGGCMNQGTRRRHAPQAEEPAPQRELSIKKFLGQKGAELAKEDDSYADATPEYVLENYYTELVSEGSGQYDAKEMRAYGQFVAVKPDEVAWFNKQMDGSERDFKDEVFGSVIADALSAIGGSAPLALALTVAKKGA